ncbi:MAG TPA: isoprenylcysteine carboxylmethyltransferase family protein [Gemmatimonadaceae bacterium]
MTDRVPLSNAGVRFPPPLLFVIGFLAGWVLDRYWHALPLSRFAGSALKPFGWAALALGVVLSGWGVLTFRRAKTAIVPHHSASQLVTHGPYRFTRNPMYTGSTIVYLGGAALLDSAWPVIVLPAVILFLVETVISREEMYLRDAFGAEYTGYAASVRRWL